MVEEGGGEVFKQARGHDGVGLFGLGEEVTDGRGSNVRLGLS